MRTIARIVVLAVITALVIFGCARVFPEGAFAVAHRLRSATADGIAYYVIGRSQRSLVQTVGALKTEEWVAGQTAVLRGKSRLASSDSGMELWQTPFGSYWIPQGDSDSLFFLLAEEATEIYGAGEAAVQKGDVVLDCGAHIGVVARRALEAGASLVVAIEPGREALACLRRNLAKEIADGRVVVCPKGVWDKEDRLLLSHHPGGTISDSFVFEQDDDKNNGRYWAPLTTIDLLVAELKLSRVDFIKMDIEGAERNALAGARETLKRFRPRMSVCVYHRPDDLAAIPQVVLGARPDYQMRCLRCTRNGRFQGYVRYDVAHFQ